MSPTDPGSGCDQRQRALVPPERLAECHAFVIGVGAIGRQVALQLAALGISRLTLFDHDVVAPENLAPQGYLAEDLHRPKVSATAAWCRRLQPLVTVTTYPDRFKRSTPREVPWDGNTVVFCCVDSIRTRRMIWDAIKPCARFFVDGRMSAEVIRVVSSAHPAIDSSYPSTLFAAEEAFAGACTARSTIYTASIAAGLMLHQFCRWLRGLPVERDLLLNLLASELTVKADPTAL